MIRVSLRPGGGMRRALALAPLLLAAAPAEAHLVSSGVGPVYDGALHFLLSPADTLAVLALALLAGQNGAGAVRLTAVALPVSWLVGGLAGLGSAAEGPPPLAWASPLVLGCLVAAGARISGPLVLTLAAAIGLAHGYLNGAAMPAALPLVGIAAAVLALTCLAGAATVAGNGAIGRIAVRVIGSWTGAFGLLALGWSLR